MTRNQGASLVTLIKQEHSVLQHNENNVPCVEQVNHHFLNINAKSGWLAGIEWTEPQRKQQQQKTAQKFSSKLADPSNHLYAPLI